MSSVAPRLRDDLADLEPYDPDMRDVEVMLSANENSYGLPEDVRAEMGRRVAGVVANRYPDATSRRLRGMLADLWGASARNVIVGNGGDELIFNSLLAFGGPSRAAVVCTPTFSAYALYAQLTGTPVVEAPRNADFSLDEEAVVAACSGREGVVFLTSPNNPSGNLTSPDFVRRLACSTDMLIVVDEAYADFADPSASCVPLVAEFANVCVLKTLSKAYALAGARLGFVVAPDAVADGLLAVRQPYSVSRFDQAAAEVVLEMHEKVEATRDALIEGRRRLAADLAGLAAEAETSLGAAALEVFPSEANFLLVRFAEGNCTPSADEVHERLATQCSVLVRNFSHTPGLAGCLRITVGTPQENEVLLASLRRVLGLDAAAPAGVDASREGGANHGRG